jgi:hypothetical protein
MAGLETLTSGLRKAPMGIILKDAAVLDSTEPQQITHFSGTFTSFRFFEPIH